MPGDFDTNDQPTLVALRDPRLNTIVDHRFRVVRVLGEGGMGVVYEAVQLSVDRLVAIKMLRREPGEPSGGEDDATRRRLLREVRLLTQVSHPNIINVLDGGVTDSGAVYFVMERLDGVTLHDRLAAGPLPWRTVCELAVQLCEALIALHERGIVHRDLKPGNIMLVDEPARGELVKVLDFGIAKAVARDGAPGTMDSARGSQLTLAGALIGTPHYMAPEAIDGELDTRIDLYALGCVVFEMLAGTPPFAHANLDAVLWHQLSQPPPPLPEDTPHALAEVVYALLAKARHERPDSAAVVRDTLLAILEPEPASVAAALLRRPPVSLVRPTLRAAAPPPALAPPRAALRHSSQARARDPAPAFRWSNVMIPVAALIGLMLVAFLVTLAKCR